jgi:hypothetical protein
MKNQTPHRIRWGVIVAPLLFWLVSLGATRLLIAPPENCGDITAESARNAAIDAMEWVAVNQLSDGRYTYLYDRSADAPIDDYNVVRHAGVTMSLYQVAGRLDRPDLMEAADAGTAWMIDNLQRHDNWAALADNPRATLGSSALMMVALADRRLATGDEQYDDVMREVGRFLMAMQRDDGGFFIAWQFDRNDYDRVGTSVYYPGEALWALALLHEALPDLGADVAARRAVDFITIHRDAVEGVRYPPLNDHWASYGMAEMAEWQPPLRDENIDYARRLAGRFSLFIRFEAQKSDNAIQLAVRGDDRSSSALGTWVEGQAALWRLASSDERMADLRDDIRDSAACGAGILAQRQAPDADGPAEAGAWFIDDITRMDDQQHAASGLLYTADALDGRERREPDVPAALLEWR